MQISPSSQARYHQTQGHPPETMARQAVPLFSGSQKDKFEKLFFSGDKQPTSANSSSISPFVHIDKGQPLIPLEPLAKSFTSIPSALSFRERLAQNNIKYIGTLPVPLQNTGLESTQVLKTMDGLAKALRYIDGHVSSSEKYGFGIRSVNLPIFTFRLGNKDVQVTKAGVGAVGHVYQLEVDGHQYAMKVFNDPERMDIHGSYSEIGLYTYFSKFPIKNTLNLHCAHPQEQGGWAILEWWDNETAKDMNNRPGMDVHDLLEQEGLHMTDDWSGNRGPGNMFWDLGGIAPNQSRRLQGLNDFEKLLKDPKGSMDAGRRLSELHGSDLDQALELSLRNPASSAQTIRSCKYLVDPKSISYFIEQGLKQKESRGRAGYDIDQAEPSQRKNLFKIALQNPQSAYEASKMIDKLPSDEDRADAVMNALDVPEARGMATRNIFAIKSKEAHTAACQKAMQYPASKFALLSLLGNHNTADSMQEYFKSYGVEMKS